MPTFLILPNTLFEKSFLKEYKDHDFVLWEHPQYFTEYNFNKKKLILHRATMQYYKDYLTENDFSVKHYYNFNNKVKITNYSVFDPIDKLKLPGSHTMVETPNFLGDKELYAKYRDRTDNFFFNAFYMWMKKELDIIPHIKSQDKFNRDKIKTDIEIPNLPSNASDDKYIKEAVTYVKKHFKDNYGNTDNFEFPVTHATAKRWLSNFLSKKLKLFGKYQDAILKNESYLFHSVLSTSINVGLLNPLYIVDKVLETPRVSIHSVEGYIRQLFWREYQRYCYIYFNFNNKNYFRNNKKLTEEWYTGKTGIPPVDDCIKSGFETGYLHHIERLMVVGNWMNLKEINPWEGFRWFMEFSCDSYEWVMYQNVLEMVFFISGGATMRKPYISSSNYILKMSNYPKGEWAEEWKDTYHSYVEKHKNELWKYRYHFPTLRK